MTDEFTVMQQIDKLLSDMANEPRQRILTWVNSKFQHITPSVVATPPLTAAPKKKASSHKTKSTSKTKKKSGKQSFSMDKTLNLFPDGKVSFKEFAEDKAPSSQQKKMRRSYLLP